jgi:two-component system sensor histidine kinase RpfC
LPKSFAEARRILVADPVATSRLVLEKVLIRAGHTVVSAADAATAMQLLGDQSTTFDALVIDRELPDMSAAALAQKYRAAEKRFPPLCIIGLEAADSPALARAAGINAVIAKPVNFGALLDLIIAAPSPAMTATDDDAGSVTEAATQETAAPSPVAEPGRETESDGAPEGPAIDLRALGDLQCLGGPEFVREIVNQFIVDGARALRNLARLSVDKDVEMFRDQAHALRSSAANVGARSIYETCLSWRAIAPEQLARDGAMHMRTLNRQFQDATKALEDYIAQLDAGEADKPAAPPAGAKTPHAA